MKSRIFWPALGWAFFMLVICNRPMGDLGSNPIFFKGFDKLTHAGLFFVFTIFWCYGLIKTNKKLNLKQAFTVTATGILFGAAIELLQLYVFTWRSGEWADLFCDTVGIGMGIFAVYMIQPASYEKT